MERRRRKFFAEASLSPYQQRKRKLELPPHPRSLGMPLSYIRPRQWSLKGEGKILHCLKTSMMGTDTKSDYCPQWYPVDEFAAECKGHARLFCMWTGYRSGTALTGWTLHQWRASRKTTRSSQVAPCCCLVPGDQPNSQQLMDWSFPSSKHPGISFLLF